MSGLLAIAFPVFGLIAVGFLARWAGLLSARAGEGLSEFVFVCAVPTLIFRTLAEAKAPAVQPWSYWAAYFLGLALVWAAAMFLARRRFATTHGMSVVAGFSAAQSNTVLVGIPLILKAYGEAGAVPLFLLIAIHLPITMTTATLLMEGASGLDARQLARRLLLHPILLGLFAGLAFRTTGLALDGPLRQLVDMLAAAAAPCALVAMGLTLKQAGWPRERGLLYAVVALKLIVHPALVWILATRVFTMPVEWAGVAVLFAAMPSGINAYLFAERYKEGVAFSSAAIALTTTLAAASAVFWLWWLGVS
jgi:hypothetical protein